MNRQNAGYFVPYVEPQIFGTGVVGLDILSGKLIAGSASGIQSHSKPATEVGKQQLLKAASGLFGDGSSGLAHAANVVTCDVPFSETGTANQTCYEKVMSYLPRCSDSISNQSIKRGDFVKLGRVLLPKTDLASAYAVIGIV